jgi:hypothetical protein
MMAATPQNVLEKLHGAIVQALGADQARASFRTAIMRAVPTTLPDDAKAWLRGEMAAWGQDHRRGQDRLTCRQPN